MPTGYGQFCPVAKAMELLDERWTILVVRELALGSRHFNSLRRGLPRMSPTLLSNGCRPWFGPEWSSAGRTAAGSATG